MAKLVFETVDDYLEKQPENVQATLARVRAILSKTIRGAEEVISYQIPAYKLEGRAVLYFAGWKDHYSIYPVTDALIEQLKTELAPYIASKGTLRFPLGEKVPSKLIERVAKVRTEEVKAQLALKGKLPRKEKKKITKKVAPRKKTKAPSKRK